MNRRNRKKNPNDIFGLEELLDAWMDMMAVIPQIDARIPKTALFGKPKHEGTMSYEERDKDIVFTIDMPGVQKKDITVTAEEHSISVKANNGKRDYNYKRSFKPSVDPASAKATFTNGVLDITLTKTEATPAGKVVKIK